MPRPPMWFYEEGESDDHVVKIPQGHLRDWQAALTGEKWCRYPDCDGGPATGYCHAERCRKDAY